MRLNKLEQGMVDAIKARANWKQGNTEVKVERNGTVTVRLYGTLIASLDGRYADGYRFVTVSHGGYKTALTKRRINAVLTLLTVHVSVYQRQGQWYVDAPWGEAPFGNLVSFDCMDRRLQTL